MRQPSTRGTRKCCVAGTSWGGPIDQSPQTTSCPMSIQDLSWNAWLVCWIRVRRADPEARLRSVAAATRRPRTVRLQLPTNWCAVNFAFTMAEDIRVALLMVDGIREVVVQLGEHCSAPQIEAAVNSGKSFDEAFPAEHHGGLFALRQTFLRKGFLFRQERLLRALRAAGLSASTISRLRVCDEASDAFTSATAAIAYAGIWLAVRNSVSIARRVHR